MVIGPGGLFPLRTVIKPDVFFKLTAGAEGVAKFFVEARTAVEGRQVVAGDDNDRPRDRAAAIL